VHVVAGDEGDLHTLPSGSKFIIDLDRLEYGIDIRILGIGECEGICGVQACCPAEDGALDSPFIPDIVIAIDTKNQCPPRLHHNRNRDLSIKLLLRMNGVKNEVK